MFKHRAINKLLLFLVISVIGVCSTLSVDLSAADSAQTISLDAQRDASIVPATKTEIADTQKHIDTFSLKKMCLNSPLFKVEDFPIQGKFDELRKACGLNALDELSYETQEWIISELNSIIFASYSTAENPLPKKLLFYEGSRTHLTQVNIESVIKACGLKDFESANTEEELGAAYEAAYQKIKQISEQLTPLLGLIREHADFFRSLSLVNKSRDWAWRESRYFREEVIIKKLQIQKETLSQKMNEWQQAIPANLPQPLNIFTLKCLQYADQETKKMPAVIQEAQHWVHERKKNRFSGQKDLNKESQAALERAAVPAPSAVSLSARESEGSEQTAPAVSAKDKNRSLRHLPGKEKIGLIIALTVATGISLYGLAKLLVWIKNKMDEKQRTQKIPVTDNEELSCSPKTS